MNPHLQQSGITNFKPEQSASQHRNCQNHDIPINEKYALSVREAASYFNIGTKKIRRLADENLGNFAFCCGNRYLIIRSKFEEYLQNTSSI